MSERKKTKKVRKAHRRKEEDRAENKKVAQRTLDHGGLPAGYGKYVCEGCGGMEYTIYSGPARFIASCCSCGCAVYL